MKRFSILNETDLPFEVVILLIAGMTMLITGVLLFPVSSGTLPYYEAGLYGLLLVMFALQIITMGKTPFGDMRRSKPLLAAGVVIAAIGIVTCFIPDILSQLPRILLIICFGPGSLLLLLQMCFDKSKLRVWLKYGGIFWHLILGCSLIYVLSMFISLLLWKQNLLTTHMTAAVVLVYGAAIVYLAVVLWRIYHKYPEAEKQYQGDVELSIDQAMLLQMAVFMILLGVLLVPVNFGMLPFAGSAQLGFLMVMLAVKMLASGSTSIGQFPRSWLMIVFGLLFAAMGIVSCIIPQILVPVLTILVGVLNILEGVIGLLKICGPLLKKTAGPRVPTPPVLVKLTAAQLTMNLLTIMFGTSMLVSNMIPGVILGVVLATNGCILLYLLHLLVLINKMKKVAGNET